MVPTRKSKLILTGACCASYAAFGLAFSLFGPTLIDLVEQTKSSQLNIGYVMSGKQIAYCFGSLICGKLFDRYNRQLGMAASLGALAVFIATVPLCGSLISFTANQLGAGLVMSAMEVATNALALEMWKQDANPYMQAMHFSYALGSAIGPFISEPFLSQEPRVDNSTTTTTTMAPELPLASKSSQIWIPFLIGGFTLLLVAALQLFLFYRLPYKSEERSLRVAEKSIELTDQEKQPPADFLPRSYYVTVVTLGALLLYFEGGIEMNTFNYLQTFVVNSKLKLSKSTGALMSGTLNTAFTVSRGLSIFVAMKLRTLTMLYMNLTVIMIGNLIIFISGSGSGSAGGMWLGIVILGFGFSSTWPGVFAFIEERITATNSVCSIFMFATSLHAAIAPLVEGQYIEQFPMIFAYINISSGVICCAAYGTLHWTDFWKRKLLAPKRSKL